MEGLVVNRLRDKVVRDADDVRKLGSPGVLAMEPEGSWRILGQRRQEALAGSFERRQVAGEEPAHAAAEWVCVVAIYQVRDIGPGGSLGIRPQLDRGDVAREQLRL